MKSEVTGMQTETLKEKIEQIGDDVAEIKKLLTGNGEPSKGLVVRVDRLEQSEQRRNKLTTTALCSSIAAFVGLLIKLFVHA